MTQTMERNVIKPRYYDKFSCIGSQCEDNCCHGWDIVIDKNTYMKYRNVKSPVFSTKQERYIKRIKGKGASDLTYAQFQMTDDGRCPFQAPDDLCEIHRDLGEDYLCRTCKCYPRMAKSMTDDYAELSLSMSCPEVARIALFNEEGIDFIAETAPFKTGDLLLQGIMSPQAGSEPTKYIKYGWDMREAAITIMQMRDCPVAYRLIVIAMMLQEVVRLHDEEKYGQIKGALEYYTNGVYGEQFINDFSDIKPDEELQMQINTFLFIDFTHRARQTRSTVFKDLVHRIMQHFTLTGDTGTVSDKAMAMGFHYFTKETEQAHWSTFLEKWEYVLENYFVNYMFTGLFPLLFHKEGLNPYLHTFLLAEQYAMLKKLLCGNYNEDEGFSKSYIVKTISQVAVLNQHSRNPLAIVQNYRDAGIDTPAHLYYLLF